MTARVSRVRGMGLELAVVEWPAQGQPHGDAVLIHGFQDVAWSWDLVAPELAKIGYRVIAPDLRGFGDSDRVHPSGYYYFPDYVFDLVELVDQVCGSKPIALVGHSMGGNVAAMYAGLYPERVHRLALLEGVGPPSFGEEMVIDREHAWIDGVRKARARPEKSMTFDEVVRRLSIGHPGVRDEILRRRAEQLSRPAGDGLFTWAFDPIHRTRSPIPFSVERWRAHARRITAPTLCIGGGASGFHPDDEPERIASIRHARAVEIPDAGHMMHWTRPEEVARLLVGHLSP